MRRKRAINVRPRARRDLDEIADYLAQESAAGGRRFYIAAQQAFKQLAAMPGMGAAREFEGSDLGSIRTWRIRGFPSFLVFYRPLGNGIEVIRVLHGARDIEAIFREEGDVQ